jgi:hypothetical protein
MVLTSLVVSTLVTLVYKGVVQRGIDRSLEQLKSRLDLVSKKDLLTFGVIYEERRRQIFEMYNDIVWARTHLNRLLCDLQSRSASVGDRYRDADLAVGKMQNSRVSARLILTDGEYSKLEAVVDKYRELMSRAETQMSMCRDSAGNIQEHLIRDSVREVLRSLYEEVRSTVDGSEAELVNEFRRILGVSSN